MIPLTDTNIEYATVLTESTHGIIGIYVWLFLDSDWIGVSRKHKNICFESEMLLISYSDNILYGKIKLLNETDLDKVKLLIDQNRGTIETYVSGTLCISELIKRINSTR
jgi:hypothetical protein